MRDLSGYRAVFVHAHPDDEAITTGGTIADLVRRGAEVLVVTCTLGEEGEVIGDALQLLVADEADQLGGYRIGELAASLSALGARGEFLGAAGRFRDSGMVGSPASRNPRAFVNNTDAATDLLVSVFERERPHVVITYGADGGYGHPDHIQAHRITHAAASAVGVPRVLHTVRLAAQTTALLPAVAPAGWRLPEPGELDGVTSADLSILLDDASYHTKASSMRAHATQLTVLDGDAEAPAVEAPAVHFYALSNNIVQPLQRVEHYQLGAGAPPPAGSASADGADDGDGAGRIFCGL